MLIDPFIVKNKNKQSFPGIHRIVNTILSLISSENFYKYIYCQPRWKLAPLSSLTSGEQFLLKLHLRYMTSARFMKQAGNGIAEDPAGASSESENMWGGGLCKGGVEWVEVLF